MTPIERDELKALLDALAEEMITPEQVSRLEALVLAHPEAEAQYVQYMSMVADLNWHFSAPAGAKQSLRERVSSSRPPVVPAATPEARRAWVRPWMIGVAALAGCVLVAIGLWPRPIILPSPSRPDAPPERTDDSGAVLTQTDHAVWEDASMPARLGPLPPGKLALKSGYAHLEFYNGATVILEGPAELRLISRTEAFCDRGKLRAT